MKMLALLSAVNVAVFLCLAAAPGFCAEHDDADLEKGIAAFNRGDLVGAMAAYETAAHAGSAEAQVRLAYILDHAEENSEAVRWYRAAAEQGHADGLAGLAEMYSKGEGVELNEAEALRLFEQAAIAGHKGAMRVLAAAYERGHLGVAPDAAKSAFWKSRQAIMDDAENAGE